MSETSDEPGRLPYPLTGLATALRVLLLVAAVLSAALAYLAVHLRTELDAVDPSADLVPNSAHDAVDAFFGGMQVFLLTLVGVGTAFVVWQYRAAKNNQSFGRPGALEPWWAPLGWLIPLGSLVLPGLQLHQVWKGADGTVPRGDPGWRKVPGSVVLWVWWVTYTVGQGLTLLGFTLIGRTDQPDAELDAAALLEHLDDVRLGVTLFVAGQVGLVVAAALGAATVVALTRRQEAAATALGPALSGAVPQGYGRPSPAAWHPDPTGRFDMRWWDGALWTEHVMRGDDQTVDPEPL